MVDGEGQLVSPEANFLGMHTNWLAYSAICDCQVDAYHGRIIAGLRESGKRKVMVFIHGGLNSMVEGVQRASEIADRLAQQSDAPYPIFVNWQSSFGSSYLDHLFWIRQGKSQWWAPVTFPFVLMEDVARTVVRAPFVWSYQVGHALTSLGVVSPDAKEAERRYDLRRSETLIRRGCDHRTTATRWLPRLSILGTAPVRFLTGPFVDALGSGAWENMQRRTKMLFDGEADFTSGNASSGARGGLSRFLDRLQKECVGSSEPGGEPEWEITLVGHSMGAIVLNKILRRYPDLPIRNIVYMAAACSVREYQDSVFPFLQRKGHEETKMYHLVLHEQAETNEAYFWYPEIVPRGSLLVWIDNFLQKPHTRLDRRVGRWVNLMAGIHLRPKSIDERVFIKQFDAGSGRVDPQIHGDFADASKHEFWQSWFWWK